MALHQQTETANPNTSVRLYLTLLLVQTIGVVLIFWFAFPIYRRLLLVPGQQLPIVTEAPLGIVLAVALAQIAYWYRYRRVPVAVHWHNVVLSHVVAFLGRLSFIFGGALFSLVFFRHLPVAHIVNGWVVGGRVTGLIVMLFALYCYAQELDRLGTALNPPAKTK